MIVIIHLQRGIPSKRKSSTCIDYVPKPGWGQQCQKALVEVNTTTTSATIHHCKDTLIGPCMCTAHAWDVTMSYLQLSALTRAGSSETRWDWVSSLLSGLRHSPFVQLPLGFHQNMKISNIAACECT